MTIPSPYLINIGIMFCPIAPDNVSDKIVAFEDAVEISCLRFIFIIIIDCVSFCLVNINVLSFEDGFNDLFFALFI